MEPLRESLWRWTADHPDWEPSQDWPQRVSCFAYASGDGLVLIDPLVADERWDRLDELADRAGGVAAVLVTVGWHARDAGSAARRYGARLYAPSLGEERESLAGAATIQDGADLAGAVQALLVPAASEALLYLPAPRTLVVGDVLLAVEGRLSLCPASWLDSAEDLDRVRADARRALELPLEAVAVSHGEPPLFEGRAALVTALA